METQAILLTAGSVMSVLFLAFVLAGRPYSAAVEALDETKFPLRELYVVGLVWQKTPFLRLRGKLAERLQGEARLIYGDRYATYYARMIWAQAITFAQLMITMLLLIAPFVKTGSQALALSGIGVVLALALASNALKGFQEQLDKRRKTCEDELPDVVTTLALLINSGMVIREAWATTAASAEGEIYRLMGRALEQMDNGASAVDAIYDFGNYSDSTEVRKFVSSIIQGVEKGGADLSNILIKQSSEQWEHKRQVMLQRGETAASKLLLPIGMMFAGLLVVVIVPMASSMLGAM